MMKRQIGYPTGRVNTNAGVYGNRGPMYFGEPPMMQGQPLGMGAMDSVSPHVPTSNNNSNNNNSNINKQLIPHPLPPSNQSPLHHSHLGSQITVPVALRIVPVSPTPDLLKVNHNDESTYGWNPTTQTDWMSNLFNADLDRHDQYHLSPLTDSFAPNNNRRPEGALGFARESSGSFAGPKRDSEGYRGDRELPGQYRGPDGVYRRDAPYAYDKNGRKMSRSGSVGGKKAPSDYDDDYAPDYDSYADEGIEREHQGELRYYEKDRLDGLKGAPKPQHHLPNTHPANQHYQPPGYYHHNPQYGHPNADSFAPDQEFQARQLDVKRSRLPAHAVSVLKEWFFKHSHSPYPTEEEKEKFTKELSLTILQVNNWFTNARRRLLPDRI
jgi:hypothetical protein